MDIAFKITRIVKQSPIHSLLHIYYLSNPDDFIVKLNGKLKTLLDTSYLCYYYCITKMPNV